MGTLSLSSAARELEWSASYTAGVAETEGGESIVDANKRFRDELSDELALTLARLSKCNADVQEVTMSAMELATKLDESELSRVETLDLIQAKEHEIAELQETISRQSDYIQRLRSQVKKPLRLMAKQLLGPVRNVARKDSDR